MCSFTRKIIFAVVAFLVATSPWPSPATAQVLGFKCGASIESNVASSTKARSIKSTNFVKLHDTGFTVTLGTAADCAVVLFTAQTACKGASAKDTCYIRAFDNGVQVHPAAGSGAVLDSESTTPSAHALAWVQRGPIQGTHHFTIEVRVGKIGTTFVIDNWTVHVQLFS